MDKRVAAPPFLYPMASEVLAGARNGRRGFRQIMLLTVTTRVLNNQRMGITLTG
jgi:hypothetical protein